MKKDRLILLSAWYFCPFSWVSSGCWREREWEQMSIWCSHLQRLRCLLALGPGVLGGSPGSRQRPLGVLSCGQDFGTDRLSLCKGGAGAETARGTAGQMPKSRDFKGDGTVEVPNTVCKLKTCHSPAEPLRVQVHPSLGSTWFREMHAPARSQRCWVPRLCYSVDEVIKSFLKTGFNWTVCGEGHKGKKDGHTKVMDASAKMRTRLQGRKSLGWAKSKSLTWDSPRASPTEGCCPLLHCQVIFTQKSFQYPGLWRLVLPSCGRE